jgi:hypothetical protein
VDSVRVNHHPNRSLGSRSASRQFIPNGGRQAHHLAGGHLAAPRQATPPAHRSGLRPTRVAAWPLRDPAVRPWGASRASPAPGLLGRLLTSVRWSGRMTPPSVLRRTPHRSPGVSCHPVRASPPDVSSTAHWWMEGCAVACPLAPAVPPRVSGSCPSPRTCVPRCLQTPPRGDALALPLSFGSTNTWTGDFHPQA